METKLKALESALGVVKQHAAEEARRRAQAVALLDRLRELLLPVSEETANSITAVVEQAAATRKQMRELGEKSRVPSPDPQADSLLVSHTGPRAAPDGSPINGPEQRILDALGWMREIGISDPSMTAVAFLAGYSVSSSSFGTPKASLIRRGLIAGDGKGSLYLTSEGKLLPKPMNIEKSNKGLQGAVLARLGGPERRLLNPLLEAWPEGITLANLAEKAAYSATSSSFGTPKALLLRLELATVEGGKMYAAKILFPESR